MSDFEFDGPKKDKGTNRFVEVDCQTCGGDRMVVFETRPNVTTGWMQKQGLKAKGETEQYAPCPDCNPNCDTRRRGFKSPDPARVRERLSRQ